MFVYSHLCTPGIILWLRRHRGTFSLGQSDSGSHATVGLNVSSLLFRDVFVSSAFHSHLMEFSLRGRNAVVRRRSCFHSESSLFALLIRGAACTFPSYGKQCRSVARLVRPLLKRIWTASFLPHLHCTLPSSQLRPGGESP